MICFVLTQIRKSVGDCLIHFEITADLGVQTTAVYNDGILCRTDDPDVGLMPKSKRPSPKVRKAFQRK